MLHWSKETIPTSLTNIEDKLLLKDAVRNFKNILAWSGDKTVQYPVMVAREVVEKGIQCEGLRDEIYVQIIKQITNNPTPESTTQLWHLMQLCLLHFPPTPLFEHYLEAWLRDKGGDSHWYTVSTLHETQEHGVKPVPSAEQIETMTKQHYSATKESVNVHRPNLPPKTNIDEVVAINNKRAVGSVGPRPSMRSLAVAPSSPHPLPTLPQTAHAPPPPHPDPTPIIAAPPPSHAPSGGPPVGGRPMPQVPGGPRPMPQPGRGGPPTGY